MDKTRSEDGDARRHLNEMSDLVLIVDMSTGRILEANERGCAELGWRADQVVDHRLHEFVHPGDRDMLHGLRSELRDNKLGRYCQRWLHRETGEWHKFDVFARLIDLETDRAMICGRDANRLTSTEAQETGLTKLFELTDDVMIVSNSEGVIEQVNSAALRLHGPAAVAGSRLSDFIHPDGWEAFSRIPRQALRNNNRTSGRVAVIRHDGNKAIMDTRTVYDPEARRWYTVERDVTAQVEAENQLHALNEQLRRAAETDGLTRVMARQAFEEAVTRRLDDGEAVALSMIDVDDFKSVNDRFGHSCGDQLLVNIAQTLLAHAGPDDLVGRLGGDEFAMLLRVHSGLHGQLGQLTRALNHERLLDGHSVYSSCSIGVALADACPPTHDQGDAGRERPIHQLFRNADLALYKAKERGRSRFEMFEPSFGEEAQRRYEMATELHLALASGHISAAVQGIWDARTLKLCGFEALARWNHPDRGLLLPFDFLNAIGDTALLAEVNAAVIESALAALGPVLNSSDLRLAINYSPRQLRDRELPSHLLEQLQRFQVRPQSITVEITEVGLPKVLLAARPNMEKMRSMGFALAIDDFGLGAASLSAVRDYPITSLKVAGDFTTSINVDPYARAISASVAALGRDLGIEVTAEYVETQEQLDTVIALGFDAVQGHFLHRPTTPTEAAQLSATARHQSGVPVTASPCSADDKG